MKTFACSILVLFALFSFNSCQNSTVTSPDESTAIGNAPKPEMSTPVLSCSNSTKSSIDITVTAGATGAPAGFSLHWMTAADYALHGWSTDSIGCHGSFSGNASGSNYNLAAGESVTIRIGEILFDNGVSTNCPDQLLCGTEYVFRAFAHANSSFKRSEFTSNLTCSTLECESGCDAGVKSQGYWKNHSNWPVNSLMLGTVSYTQSELTSILLQNPSGGNGLVSLAHQVIAVKLSIANGADGSSISTTLAAADAMIGGLIVPPIGTGFISAGTTSSLTLALDTWIGLNECH